MYPLPQCLAHRNLGFVSFPLHFPKMNTKGSFGNKSPKVFGVWGWVQNPAPDSWKARVP